MMMVVSEEEIRRKHLVVNKARGPVRPLDRELFPDTHFMSQLMYVSESIHVLVSSVPAGADGPPAHKHPIDQFFYTLEGELELDLGAEHYTLKKGSLAFIPAGVPHKHRNTGDVAELHLELLVPPPDPLGPPVLTLVDDNTAAWEPGGMIVEVEDAERATPTQAQFSMAVLVDPTGRIADDSGSAVRAVTGCVMYEAAVPPGGGMGVNHYHTFNQLYYVTEGQMTVTIGLERYTVAADSLVVLPAYVPHNNANNGPAVERHVNIIVPVPSQTGNEDEPWDIAVDVTAAAVTR
jgi:quercetin dioxygenase-like cupin family protein